MIKYSYISLFILFVSCLSCKEHIKPQVHESKAKPPKQVEFNPIEADPYFQGTTTVNSNTGPKSISRNILQDSKGNIWLATWDGIIRYDGQSETNEEIFVNLTNKEELRRFRVFTILEDSKGNVWFGTIGAGVYQFDGSSFTNITMKEGLVDDRVTCIYEDRAGNIWFGTTGGASCYDGTSFRNYTTADGLTNDDINSIIEDRSGKFWFGTRGTACVYDGTSFTKLTTDDGMSFQNVRTIIEDKNDNIWLGGNDGLWRYNNAPLPVVSQFINYTKNFVGYIYEDSKGYLWTSSEADSQKNWAISKYEENNTFSNTIMPTEIIKQENMFFGITEDKLGGMWFGHLRGVCHYDGSSFNYFE